MEPTDGPPETTRGQEHHGATRTLTAAVAILLVGITAGALRPVHAQPDPFGPMTALRVTPPVSAPDVRFKTLDGRPAGLEAFRGRPVLLTFFTTW